MTLCRHCHTVCVLVTGREVYGHRPDLYNLYFWKCQDCPDSFVGCHREGARVKYLGTHIISDGKIALGSAANAPLRQLRSECHKAFDPKWKDGKRNRHTAYAILSAMTGIRPDDCHISMMDIAQCRKVLEVCQRPWN